MHSRQLARVPNFLGFGRALILTGCFVSAFSGNDVLAQITPDETLGAERSVVTFNVTINGFPADRIDGGATRGSNLFHSFLEFNIGNGQQVYFSSPVGIETILSRVTGTDPSDILGTLGVAGNANLFLLNPNGIIFGKNASLDVGKSFYATTANGIQFCNQGEFSTTNPQPPSSLLTINPSAFFFTAQANQGTLINQSRATQTVAGFPTDGLQVPNGQTLLLLGGNVTNDDGRLIARGGRVEIGAVAEPGIVGLERNGSLSIPEGMQRADVVFTNQASSNRSGIDVRHGNGGDIGITAGNISLFSGSQLRAGIASGFGTPESQGGDITVNATGEIRMTGDDSRMANDVRPDAIGKAGNLRITTDALVVTDGAQLSASTFGIGDAGKIVIVADYVSFRGARTDERAGSAAFSRVEEEAQGKGGTVQISTNVLEVFDGAALFTSTDGIGDAGNLVIIARDRVSFDGTSFGGRLSSGAFSTVSFTAQGKGGNLSITTQLLSVTNGAQLLASTFGRGNAGNVTISANDVSFAGIGSNEFRSAAASSVEDGAEGKGGDIEIITNSLSLTDAFIASRSRGTGKAGDITIQTHHNLELNRSQLEANTLSGDGGNMRLRVGDLLLMREGSEISTTAGEDGAGGNGGNIKIEADFIVGISEDNSDITANAYEGRGGKINITTQGIYGLEFREELTPLSDITASSTIGVDGEFQLDLLTNVDPSRGLAELPSNLVDAAAQIDRSCTAGGSALRSSFIVTGRGGIPSSPFDSLDSPAVVSEWITLDSQEETIEATETDTNSSSATPKVVEAQGWVKTPDGQVILVAQAPTIAPQIPWRTSPSCERVNAIAH